jgi:hypothetical protein
LFIQLYVSMLRFAHGRMPHDATIIHLPTLMLLYVDIWMYIAPIIILIMNLAASIVLVMFCTDETAPQETLGVTYEAR